MVIERLPAGNYWAYQDDLVCYGETMDEAIAKCLEIVEVEAQNDYEREFNPKQ